jgi:hypothetical protein
MKKHILFFTGVLMAPAAVHAQTPGELATYLATMSTPAGALAPMLTNTLLDRAQNGASLALRYGNLASGDFNPASNTFAVTGILPAGLGSSIDLTGGVITSDCTGCKAELMLGVGGDMRFMGRTMGNTSTSPMFTLSLDGELGYSSADPGSFISGYVGVPMALVQRGTGMQFAPFLTPGFAVGQFSSNGTSTNGSGLMIGGGLGIYNSDSGVIINVGAQHSFMNGARNTIGINVLLGGK